MKEILSHVESITDDMVEKCRKIHQNPELCLREYETTALLKEELTEMGVELFSRF